MELDRSSDSDRLFAGRADAAAQPAPESAEPDAGPSDQGDSRTSPTSEEEAGAIESVTDHQLTRTVVFNVAFTMVGLASAGLVLFGFNVIVGHHYGPATLGALSIPLGLGLFLGQIPGTFSAAATKFIAESLGRGREDQAKLAFRFLLGISCTLSVLLGLGVLALAPVLQATFHLPFSSVALAAALVPTYTLYLYFKSVYYGVQRVRAYIANELIADAAFYVVLTALILGAGPTWLLVAFVLNNAIFALIALRDLRGFLVETHLAFHAAGSFESPEASERRPSPAPGAEEQITRKKILRYAVVGGSGTAASLGRWSLGTTVAGLFLSHHDVGLFAAAVAITAPLPLLPRSISLVTFSLMARLYGAGQHLSVRRLLDAATEWLVLLLGLPSGLAMLNVPAILALVFRPDFAQAAIATQLIIAGAYLTDISRPSIDALASTRYVRIPTLASFAGLAVSLVIWLSLIPHFGISMSGLGFAVGALVTAGIPAYYAHRYIGSKSAVFLRPAVMLTGLGALTPVASRLPLEASLIFVIGMLVLYQHLFRDLFGYLRARLHAPQPDERLNAVSRG